MSNLPRNRKLTKEQYDRLNKEIMTPYRPLRQFIYVACGASGLIGAVVFLAKLGSVNNDWGNTLPNLALQVGIVGLMIFLFSIDQGKSKN